MSGFEIDLTPDDYQAAFNEIAFLLDGFARAIDNIMGGVTAPVGRIAGRNTARKLPVEVSDATIEQVSALLRQRMIQGFDFTVEEGRLTFSTCVLRDVCRVRGFETGGALCKLFHAYLDGTMDGLMNRPVKSAVDSMGDVCQVRLETL